ncbi:DUF935 domain-containing protein [Motilimonas cestriensis]|nr:DUF935 domain-containing protein [Motilimonas cestriensis]
MSIVDIYGNPLRSERELKQQQTHDDARLAHLQHHYDEHPTSGLTPSRLANIMREAETGSLVSQMELAEDILEKDAHVYCEVDKRRKALLGIEWNITPPRNASAQEKADAELIQQMLEDSTIMDEAILEMADGIFKAFSCLEIKWAQFDGLHVVQGLDFRPQTWFQLNPLQRDELRLRDNSHLGAALQPFGWIKHEHKAKSGYLGRAALVRQVAWPFLFKNLSVRDLGEFLEIYGLPLRLGKYPSGASENEKSTLLRAVMSIGHNAGGIIPRGMELDFHEAAKGGAEPFEAMIAWCERSQSKAIVGGTLTSQADGKSSTNALGQVHNEVRQELRDSDLKQIAATLTRDLVYPLYVLNGRSYRSAHRIPRLEFDVTEPEDIKLLSESLPGLVSLGMQIPQEWAHDKLKIPVAQKGQAVLGVSPSNESKDNLTPLVALSAIHKITPAPDDGPDHADQFSAQLRQQMGDALGSMTDGIRALVEQANSLDELAELLASHAVNVDDASAIMGQAFAAVELAGRIDVEQGR